MNGAKVHSYFNKGGCMNTKKHGILIRSALIAASCFVLALSLYSAGIFTYFENKTYDRRMVFAAQYKKPAEEIFFIEVDQPSITWAQEKYGWGWPWPREAYGHMVDFFAAGGAKSVAFDILFSEPSLYGENDDRAFARAEEESGIVIQPLNILVEYEDSSASGSLAGGPGARSAARETAQFPVDCIREGAAILGNITSYMDDDDIIRRGRLTYTYDGVTYPTLGTGPVFLEGDEALLDDVPCLEDGSVLLRYQGSLNDYCPYSAYDVLESYDLWLSGDEGFLVPEDFEDAYVFVAYYGPGLYDTCSTPVSQVFPGVGVHITTLDNILTDSFMTRAPDWIVLLWLFVMSMLGTAVVAYAANRHTQKTSVAFMAIGFALGALLSVGLPYFLFVKGIHLALIAPAASFLISFLVSVVFSMTVEGKQKRFIKAAFSQCLSKDVVNQIMNDPSSFTLGGRKFQMTAIFTDIQKFSSFSELLTAGELGSLLNFYLTRMSEIIISEHGTVDKYEGDAIVAFTGAPVEMDDHAVRACRAAIRMKMAEVELNEEIRTVAASEKPQGMEDELYNAFKVMVANDKTIFTRIGLNSGEMIAGYFGSQNKKNYTMMGNNVNLASRLEGVNKQYHTGGILISEATRNQLDERFIVRSLDRVRVVNVNKPIRLYELLALAVDDGNDAQSEVSHGKADTAVRAPLSLAAYVAAWEAAFAQFEAGRWQEAYDAFTALHAQHPDDGVVSYYMNLEERFFLKGTVPGEHDDAGVAYEEDGVFRLLQK